MPNDSSPIRWTFLTPWQAVFGVAALLGCCTAAAVRAGDAPAGVPGVAANGKPAGGAALKIYIHTDLEGISGIDSMDMIERSGKRYRECCEHLMADLNAAIEGAFAGGATHVTVLDSHGGGNNFIRELLDPRAEYDSRPNKKWWGMLDASYQGTGR